MSKKKIKYKKIIKNEKKELDLHIGEFEREHRKVFYDQNGYYYQYGYTIEE